MMEHSFPDMVADYDPPMQPSAYQNIVANIADRVEEAIKFRSAY